jgi:hypothetical protein
MPSNRASKYMSQRLTKVKGVVDMLRIIVGDIATLFLVIDRTDDQ